MNDTLEFQRRIPLSYSLGFDPGPAYSRVMYGIRERILLKGRERRMVEYWAPRIFPEEFGLARSKEARH